MRLMGCRATILVSTSVKEAQGSTSLSLQVYAARHKQVSMSLHTVAQRAPPPSLPANRWFLRPSATGGWPARPGSCRARCRPSYRNRVNPFQRASAYRIASASFPRPGRCGRCVSSQICRASTIGFGSVAKGSSPKAKTPFPQPTEGRLREAASPPGG